MNEWKRVEACKFDWACNAANYLCCNRIARCICDTLKDMETQKTVLSLQRIGCVRKEKGVN